MIYQYRNYKFVYDKPDLLIWKIIQLPSPCVRRVNRRFEEIRLSEKTNQKEALIIAQAWIERQHELIESKVLAINIKHYLNLKVSNLKANNNYLIKGLINNKPFLSKIKTLS